MDGVLSNDLKERHGALRILKGSWFHKRGPCYSLFEVSVKFNIILFLYIEKDLHHVKHSLD
mgnify:FL=1